MLFSEEETERFSEIIEENEAKLDPEDPNRGSVESLDGEERYSRLRWLVEVGHRLDEDFFTFVCEDGDLEMLEFLKKIDSCNWTAWAMAAAVEDGFCDIIVWLVENNCPWDEHVVDAALKAGRPTIAKWLIECGCPFDRDALLQRAKDGGREFILALLGE